MALAGVPNESTFYEDYPILADAWHYNEPLADPHYEFKDPKQDFIESQSNTEKDKEELDKKMVKEIKGMKSVNDSI